MFFQSLFRVQNSNSENCWWYESLCLVDLLLPPKLELPKGSDPQQLIWMTGWEPESFAIFSFHRFLASFTVQNVKSHGTRVSVRRITWELGFESLLFPIGTKPRYETPHEMRLLFSDKFCSKKPDNMVFQGLYELWEINLSILPRLKWEIVYWISSTEKLKGRRRRKQGRDITKTPGSWPDKLELSLLSKNGLEMACLKNSLNVLLSLHTWGGGSGVDTRREDCSFHNANGFTTTVESD